MASQEFPMLNGVEPSWADVSIKFPIHGGATVKTADIQGIDFSDSLEIGVIRGTGGQKRKRTTGQEDNEAAVKFYRSGLQTFLSSLILNAPERNAQKQVGLAVFDIFVDHTPPGESGIFSVRILGCRMKGRTFSMAEGAEGDVVDVPIDVMKIIQLVDGKEVVLI